MSPSTQPMSTTAADEIPRRQPPSQSHRLLPSNTREDCWSGEETQALIEAWGSRHLSLNRGSLRQYHWDDVAADVNSDLPKHRRRTDVQCKNRIDTLKKRYKIEKVKVASDSSYVSPWPFFSRLEFLITGESPTTEVAAMKANPMVATPDVVHPALRNFPVGKRSALPKRPARWLTEEDVEKQEDDKYFSSSGVGTGGGSGGGGGSREEIELSEGQSSDGSGLWRTRRERKQKTERMISGGDSVSRRRRRRSKSKEAEEDRTVFRELAGAIRRFGEVYERVESMKQLQLMELEKNRMEFAKDLEFQRMKLIIDTQLQLFSKIKRSKQHTIADNCL